ncbi:TPA: endolytic transglycosylase MltG [Streptococcus suis]|nr:endolytic transglycosylase MltG [Streptococcus suis]
MSKDTNENSTQPSSFRDQILRDLEELKVKRLAEQSNDVELDARSEVIEELQSVKDEREVVKIDEMAFPRSYVQESGQETEEVKVHFESTTPPLVEEKLADSNMVVGQTYTQDTVERNIAALRNIISENQLDLPSEEVAAPTPQASSEVPETNPLEDTFLEFPKEDVSAVTGDTEIISLSETVTVAPVAPATQEVEKKETEEPVAKQRSRSVNQKINKQKRQKRDKTAKRIVSIIMSLLVVAMLVTGIAGFFWVKSSLEPVNAKATETVQLEIPTGSTTSDIGKILAENKLIKNATVFSYYAKLKSYNNFQSGFYNLKQSMSVDEIAKALQESGTPAPETEPLGKILIVEGYTLKQISEAITQNYQKDGATTPFSSEEFMSLVTNADFINRMVAAYPKLFASLPTTDSGVVYQLEGYLFPAVYDYTEETTLEELVEQMIATMDTRLQPYYDAIAAKNLTVNEVLTLASLVEKEGSTDEDRRNIASVFFNRINAGMPLQSNIAILYAQGKLGEKTTLAEDAGIDTNIDSPYNIYWKTGLMPGPVDSPSISAIDAVINATTTEYLYFVADVTTGTVYFAKTIEEHDQNVAKYVNAHLQ